jgi:DNA-binding NtrC family response regulator
LEYLEKKIENLKTEINTLKKERTKLQNKMNTRFEDFLKEAEDVKQSLDDWSSSLSTNRSNLSPLSLLFLGGCSGQWAARTRYRGTLPSFGGFLLFSDNMKILIDPGKSTFNQLIAQGIHPQSLDLIIVTHNHWDCTRDLGLVLQAAIPVFANQPPDSGCTLKLMAHDSVINGIENTDSNSCAHPEMIAKYEPYLEKLTPKTIERMKSFKVSVPGALNIFDLYIRLQGRFENLGVGKAYNLGPNLKLFTHASYHDIGGAISQIPGLDFVAHYNGSPRVRCVYLSDTEYRTDMAATFEKGLSERGLIDVLVCNVKTLSIFKYPKPHPQAGFTQNHLGWNGLIQLTRELIDAGALRSSALIVLRAWGIETVTKLDTQDHALIATPEKLALYEETFCKKTGAKGMIPDISWVDVTDNMQHEILVDHVRPPFRSDAGYHQRFGNWFYSNQKMSDIAHGAKAVTDDRAVVVLITGASGSGKDELAKAIHAEAVLAGKRSGDLVVRNARQLPDNLAESILFGSEKGAHNQADRTTDGWLAEAQDSTLLIQEVAKLPLSVQTTFLTFLQERNYQRLGGNTSYNVTCQIIFTTSADLSNKVKSGEFMGPLYQRIDRRFEIPPLRERVEDIPCIIEGWRTLGLKGFLGMKPLEDRAISYLQKNEWPGNVRQLKRVLKIFISSGDDSLSNLERIVEDDHHDFNRSSSEDDVKRLSISFMDDKDRQILEALKESEYLSRQEIENRLIPPMNRNTLQGRLRRLREENWIQRTGRGRNTTYRLIHTG